MQQLFRLNSASPTNFRLGHQYLTSSNKLDSFFLSITTKEKKTLKRCEDIFSQFTLDHNQYL
jgi:hypothetical protein